MSFDVAKASPIREHLWVVKLTIGGNTITFCENRAPLPLGLVAIPSLSAVRTSPTEADVRGGLGVRASCSLTFKDHLDYTIFGTVTSPVRFWPNLRGRFPYYQGGMMEVLSGYIVNGTYNPANFQTRSYVIETIGSSRGNWSVVGKDPLKLADNSRAQAPRASRGQLSADLAIGATSFNLLPSGVGDSEYPASGWVRINNEVMSFTRAGDAMTVTRAQFNTDEEAHGQDDAVQLCLRYNASVTDIEYDLLTNYAGVDPSYIQLSEWEAEAGLYLPGLYDTIITEPVGVQTLLKELGEQAPHYLYWDERTNRIKFVAVKAPPSEAIVLTDENNFIEGSLAYTDQQDMRVSRVVVNFGQYDPTKDLDDVSNYTQTHIRVDNAAEVNYGTPRIKTVYSRWLSNVNRAGAVRLAARIGRRFSELPRLVAFELDPKDSDVWTGTPVFLNSEEILNNSGARFNMSAQVLSVVESGPVYQYRALEHGYGPSTPDDEDIDDLGKLIILSGELTNINLRSIFDSIYPSFDPADEVRFIFDSSCVVGSTSTGVSAVVTGSWAGLTTPPLLDIRGFILGKGGKGGDGDIALGTGENGGTALLLQHNVRIDNSGVIGGGGGGGGGGVGSVPGGETWAVGGGGGAGYLPGAAGAFTAGPVLLQLPAPGGRELGGNGAIVQVSNGDSFEGGAGGDLGQSGTAATSPGAAGGSAGAAINLNGYTITYINAGDIRGTVS